MRILDVPTPLRLNAGRIVAGRAILLAICATSLSSGCAFGARLSPSVLQSPPGAQRAAVTPGSWEKVVALRPGSLVVVTLMDGARLEGAFRALGRDDLGLTGSAGRDFAVARSNVRQIMARAQRDPLGNGALIGAGIGLGIAATVLAVAASGDGYVLASAKWGAPLLLSAVGGLIGVFVDRAHTDDQMVFVRPQP